MKRIPASQGRAGEADQGLRASLHDRARDARRVTSAPCSASARCCPPTMPTSAKPRSTNGVGKRPAGHAVNQSGPLTSDRFDHAEDLRLTA